MPMKQYTCKDCTKRNPGCHSHCAEHLAIKTYNDEYRLIVRKERARDTITMRRTNK